MRSMERDLAERMPLQFSLRSAFFGGPQCSVEQVRTSSRLRRQVQEVAPAVREADIKATD